MGNISTPYGNYGGVRNDCHYIPSPIPGFIPTPPTVPFTKSLRARIINALSGVSTQQCVTFLNATSSIMLYRILLEVNDNFKTFVMFTSSHPFDTVTYTASAGRFTMDLLRLNGGTF